MSLNLGIIASSRTAASGGTLLLDTYPGSAAAYSLRKLRTAYTGAAIRVRRDSDNTETDIGFNGVGELDTAALQSFIGSENYLYWSQDFTQSIWTKTAVTVTANAGTAPDGTNTAQKCVPSAAVTTKAIFQNITSVSTRDYVFSIYAKSAEYNYMQLLAIRDSTNRYSIIVDLTTGAITQTNTVGTPNFINSSVTSVGNGWYRIVITLNINLGTNYFVFSPSPVSNPTLNASLDLQNAGNGTSGVLFWGAQLNYFSLRPYQVTTTTQAIFASGFVTIWYDQSGNARNAVQTTTTNQPTIVALGVLQIVNTKPSINFVRANSTRFTLSGILTGNEQRTQIAVYKPTVTSGVMGIFGQGTNLNTGRWSFIQARSGGASGDPYFAGYAQDLGNGLTTLNTDTKIGSFMYNGTTGYLWKNNTQLATANLTLNTLNTDIVQIGMSGIITADPNLREPLDGFISECILYTSNQLTNISAINSNINSFYTIY